MLTTIAFDADDTLWHNEIHYLHASEKLQQILSTYAHSETIEKRLAEIEINNVPLYGYGIKSYTLSMIETAIELSGNRISNNLIRQIIGLGQEMLSAKVYLFDKAEETLAALSTNHRLMLVTKGDLLEQEEKIKRSGLVEYFSHVEIIREKSTKSYLYLLDRYGLHPSEFMMVGNSLKSDIYPVMEIGAQAVYIPYHLTWAQELPEKSQTTQYQYHEIEYLAQLPELISKL